MATPARTMNFFERQDKARRNTALLIILFSLAVLLIIIAIYFLAQFAIWYTSRNTDISAVENFHLWDIGVFFEAAIAVIIFIGSASLYKVQSLRSGGGGKVAEMLGGRLVTGDAGDHKERQLLNVVEEMAIASGVPVPQVYLLENEFGINAFAAGFTPNDAVIAVTKGALNAFTRDELQGVIAHEFSHIFNGDMRMNIRLIGILYGILVIGVIGQYVLRGAAFGSHRTRRSSRGGGSNGFIFVIALSLLIIGYVGHFIGRIIQAAVTRQKEFLADASAVQFTRNPDGIGGALKKIGGNEYGSKIESPAAGQASHLFFGEGKKAFLFSGMLATHPPLIKRITRILPDFDGVFPQLEASSFIAEGATMGFGAAGAQDSSGQTQFEAYPDQVVGQVGTLSSENLATSTNLLHMIPDNTKQAVHDPAGAVRAVFALLLDEDSQERQKQVDALSRQVDQSEIEAVLAMYPDVAGLDRRTRLPLLDLALPVLRSLPPDELQSFLAQVETLVISDGKVTMFEFCLQWLLNYRLLRARRKRGKVAYLSFSPLRKNLSVLLATIAQAGNPEDPEAAREAYDKGAARIPDLAKSQPSVDWRQKINFGELGAALDRLVLASFPIKERVIDACAHCAFADRTVTVEEAELLRVVSVSLDCPLPPFVASSEQ